MLAEIHLVFDAAVIQLWSCSRTRLPLRSVNLVA
jgi:hypothetical protein